MLDFLYLEIAENTCPLVCLSIFRQIDHPEEVNSKGALPASWLINLNTCHWD